MVIKTVIRPSVKPWPAFPLAAGRLLNVRQFFA